MGPWESMPWFGMFFAPIMVIAVLATVVIVVVLVVRWLGGGFSPGNVPSLPPPTAGIRQPWRFSKSALPRARSRTTSSKKRSGSAIRPNVRC